MIEFKNEKLINECLVNLENHLDLLKANFLCNKLQCKVIDKPTEGYNYKNNAREAIDAIRINISMIDHFLKP
jgi:hypothetical protein